MSSETIILQTFSVLLRCGYGRSRRGCSRGVHACGSAEVFDDLGVGARRAPGTLLQQLGYERGGVALDQGVLLLLDRLHERPHQRVEFVGKCLQVDRRAGGEHVDAQVQLLPVRAGLHHRRLGLLTFTLQHQPLLGLHVQTRGSLCEDGGNLGNK